MLIIDDHELTARGYGYLLENAALQNILPKFVIDYAQDTKSAYRQIMSKVKTSLVYDIVLLDINLPSYPEKKIFTGEDVGKLLRKVASKTKIIVQTALTDNHLLYNLFQSIDPDAIALKSEWNEEEFVRCIQNVLESVPYYSAAFSKLIRQQFSKPFILDNEDRELLYLLSIGVSSKEIPKYLPWSSSKVEKRKRILREKFGVEEKNLLSLLRAVKVAGFI